MNNVTKCCEGTDCKSAPSDILAFINSSNSQNDLKENEVILKIVDTVIIDKKKAIGNWYVDQIYKDTVIRMPADTMLIKIKSWFVQLVKIK